ncbi:TIGR01777 family protein [bacterium]|nr:TIGR01777 family protein [bacterium]
MDCFILGGTGLIGRRLTYRLLQRGQEVTVASRGAPPGEETWRRGVRLVHWDGYGRDPCFIARLQGAGSVVNLAGEGVVTRWTAKAKEEILASRMAATEAVSRLFRPARPEGTKEEDAPPRRPWINASAVGFYGQEGDLADESTPPGQGFLAAVCRSWEAAVQPAPGVRSTIFRLGVVLAPEGGAFVPMNIPYRLQMGGWLGSGRQAFPWVHVNDVVEAILWTLSADDAEGVFNVVSPAGATETAKSFAIALNEAWMRPPYRLQPAPLAALAGMGARLVLGEAATLLLDGRPVSTGRLEEAGFRYLHTDARRAAASLLS